jgi:hypothetical protein
MNIHPVPQGIRTVSDRQSGAERKRPFCHWTVPFAEAFFENLL